MLAIVLAIGICVVVIAMFALGVLAARDRKRRGFPRREACRNMIDGKDCSRRMSFEVAYMSGIEQKTYQCKPCAERLVAGRPEATMVELTNLQIQEVVRRHRDAVRAENAKRRESMRSRS